MKTLRIRSAAALAALFLAGVASAADGSALANQNGCMACHAGNKPMIAPSFAKISARYKDKPGAQAELVSSIKNGSKAKWGVMVMRPNPNISDDDARVIADWLLKH